MNAANFVLFHANSLRDSQKFVEHIARVKKAVGTRKTIVINEDDNFDFDSNESHLSIALKNYLSWEYFDYRKQGVTDLKERFQTIPVDWGINSENKKAFFN